jgi:hypothetical protein
MLLGVIMMMQSKILSVATLVVMTGLVACRGDGGFTGKSGSGTAPSNPPPPVAQPMPQPIPAQPAGCTEAKLVSVTSMTSVIDQRLPTRSIDVQLTFQPCPQMSNLNYNLWFDLDAKMTSNQNLTYQFLGNGTVPTSGTVNFVQGQDLFGKTGNQYFHFESRAPIVAPSSLQTATLRINLGNVKIEGPVAGPTPTGNFQIPLHVKIGNMPPVTGNITFTLPY